jgi:prolyl-tRNA synthetase
VHKGLYEKAKKNLDEKIFKAKTVLEAKELIETKGGFIKTPLCGDLDCDLR